MKRDTYAEPVRPMDYADRVVVRAAVVSFFLWIILEVLA